MLCVLFVVVCVCYGLLVDCLCLLLACVNGVCVGNLVVYGC